MRCSEYRCTQDAPLLVRYSKRIYPVCTSHYEHVQAGRAITMRGENGHVIGYAAGVVTSA